MRIEIRSSPRVEPGLVELARTRLLFALGRFGSRIRSATIRLDDLNGPRGGIDQYCSVIVRVAGPRRLVKIEETADQGAVAIAVATERAGRTVARLLNRLSVATPSAVLTLAWTVVAI